MDVAFFFVCCFTIHFCNIINHGGVTNEGSRANQVLEPGSGLGMAKRCGDTEMRRGWGMTVREELRRGGNERWKDKGYQQWKRDRDETF